MSTMTATAKGQLEQKMREQEVKRLEHIILHSDDRNASANVSAGR